MKTTNVQITALLTLFLAGCMGKTQQKAAENIPHSKADQVVNKAIAWAGGMERWNNLEQLTYTKRSKLLLEDESVEYDITQRHEYQLIPSLVMDIYWETKGDRHRMIHTDSASLKYMNDSLIDQGQKVKESAFSAFYVLGMPFKLKDPGIHLTYEGQRTFRNKTADVVKATYSPATYDNHSTSDDWWYYFDAADGAFLGCMVYHAPTYAMIENIAFHEVDGMKFQKRRMSYRCDSLGTKQFLRAEFWYEDYEAVFIK